MTTPLKANFRALRALGVWPITKDEAPVVIRAIYVLYVLIVVLVVQTVYIILEWIDACKSWGDLGSVTENVCLSITHLAGLIKVINLLIQRKRMSDCLDLLGSMSIISGSRGRPDMQMIEKEIVANSERHALLIFALFCGLVSTTAFAGIINAGFFDPTVVGNKFMFRVWVPPGISFLTSYVYMSVCVLVNALIILTIDTTMMGFMVHLCGQLKILEICLRSIGNSGENNEDENTLETSPTKQEEMCIQLKHCIQHHQAIIKLRDEVEGLFSSVVLLQFVTSLAIIGLTGFQVIVNLKDIAQHFTIFAYLLCVLSEILIYCWFAHQVIIQSGSILSSVYDSSWITGGPKFCSSMLIFGTRAQKTLNLTAGGFAVLSLDTFTLILSRSYSYMAVLQQLYYEA